MKTALIPPIPHLQEFGVGDFHLVLSHLLSDDRYLNHYVEQANQGAYIVLDNSAHENTTGNPPLDLFNQALLLGARELVVPDHLWNRVETEKLARRGLHLFSQETIRKQLDDRQIRLMLVPQGETVDEWVQCFRNLLEIYWDEFRDRRFVIGMSKDYEVWPGGLGYLISNHIYPAYLSQRNFDVHLLGWGRQLSKLRELSIRFPWIRSTDSAKPFVYAKNGIKLERNIDPAYPKRDDNYFTETLSSAQLSIARHNVKLFSDYGLGV